MTAVSLFYGGNAVGFLGWLLLFLAVFDSRVRQTAWMMTGLFLPTLLALFYAAAIAKTVSHGFAVGADPIATIRLLFADDDGLAAGWIHYVAFDLFVGHRILRGALSCNLNRGLVVFILILTAFLGPLGFLAYVLARGLARKGLPA